MGNSDSRLTGLTAFHTHASAEAYTRRWTLGDAVTAACIGWTGTQMRADLPSHTVWVEALVHELSNLHVEASFDAVARMIGAAIRLPRGNTAPQFFPLTPGVWAMSVTFEENPTTIRTVQHTFGDVTDTRLGSPLNTHVLGLRGVTDPIEALTLIALATLT